MTLTLPIPRGKTTTASQRFETVIKVRDGTGMTEKNSPDTASQRFETVIKVRDGTGMTEKNSPDTAEPALCILHKRRLNLRR